MTLDEQKAYLIDHLEVWQETHDPCERGHIEHGPEAHLGRRLVHSMAGAFGADWDEEAALTFIRAAERIGPLGPQAQALNRHAAVWSGGRLVAFATTYRGKA